MDKIFIWENIKEWSRTINSQKDIWDYYTYIPMYHACKPININSYYENGIKILNLESLKKTATDYFILLSFSMILKIQLILETCICLNF